MFNFYVDAETDGLYGKFLSIAVLVRNENGREIDRFYAAVNTDLSEITEPWVLDNVFPYLKNAETFFDTENEMLEAFWQFWMKYRDTTRCIAYVPYPVECRLFATCVELNRKERAFLAPFPLYDLSTLLYARGYDSLGEDLSDLINTNLPKHDAMNDVVVMAMAWEKLMSIT